MAWNYFLSVNFGILGQFLPPSHLIIYTSLLKHIGSVLDLNSNFFFANQLRILFFLLCRSLLGHHILGLFEQIALVLLLLLTFKLFSVLFRSQVFKLHDGCLAVFSLHCGFFARSVLGLLLAPLLYFLNLFPSFFALGLLERLNPLFLLSLLSIKLQHFFFLLLLLVFEFSLLP